MGFVDKVRAVTVEPPPAVAGVTRWEYRTETLTSVIGRDKLRMGDLEETLARLGREGWELASAGFDVDMRGKRDGHLLIFKRPLV
jgi:hypothetical protein